MAALAPRSHLLLILTSIGCSDAARAVVLLPDLPPDIERLAVLRFDEGGALTGSSGLLSVSQLPIELEDEDTSSITIAGFDRDAFADVRRPSDEVLESTPVRLALEGDRLLPTPEFFVSGALVDGTVSLAPTAPSPLTSNWLEGPCPSVSVGRVERVRDDGQFLGFASIDARTALLVTIGTESTSLFAADFDSTVPLDPPGFSADGPGGHESTAAFYENGRLWLASAPTDGLTRIFSGTLESGFELVSTSTRGERIGWLAPDRNDAQSLLLLDSNGVYHRVSPNQAGWERHAMLVGAAAEAGRVAREPDGSLVVLYRSFPVRDLARINPRGVVTPIPREGRHRPIYMLDLLPYPTFLAYDGLSSRIFEVRGPDLVVLPGSESGTSTVEPLTMARITGGFAASGVQGYLMIFTEGTFCPVESGILGPNTVEHIVEVEGGLLTGPGRIRNRGGPADLTRVRLD